MLQNKIDSPILITGIQRSGASLVAKIIAMCGGLSGNCSPMMENLKLKQLMDTYYSFIGADEKGQYPLPDLNTLTIPVSWKKDVVTKLMTERQVGETAYMYKSNRICQVWPLWNYAFPNAKWIIVRRRSGDIIQSCLKTSYMEAFKNPETRELVGAKNERDGWLWWIHEHEKRFVEMIEEGLNCKVIWPERMVYGDYAQIYEMLEWLGLKWNDNIINTIDPLLWNTRNKERV